MTDNVNEDQPNQSRVPVYTPVWTDGGWELELVEWIDRAEFDDLLRSAQPRR